MGTPLTRRSIPHGFWKAACGRDGECVVKTAFRLRLVVLYDENLGCLCMKRVQMRHHFQLLQVESYEPGEEIYMHA